MLNVAGNAEVQPVRIGETLYKSLRVVVSYKPRPLFYIIVVTMTIIKNRLDNQPAQNYKPKQKDFCPMTFDP